MALGSRRRGGTLKQKAASARNLVAARRARSRRGELPHDRKAVPFTGTNHAQRSPNAITVRRPPKAQQAIDDFKRSARGGNTFGGGTKPSDDTVTISKPTGSGGRRKLTKWDT